MLPHAMARPVLDRGGASDRLRNHLRRRAITRLGLIEGDLYLLPYWRVAGHGPQGETGLHLLAAELGDPRLAWVRLPPADFTPFAHGAVPPGACLVEAGAWNDTAKKKAESKGWRIESLEELIHYPFWLMRVEDSGRFEGAWIDGVEGRVIHHTLTLPRPIPPMKTSALLLGAPAILMAVSSLALDHGGFVAAAAVLATAAGGGALAALMENDVRKERKG